MAGKTGEGTQAVIHQVLPRKSVFMRKAAGSDRKEQLVATNIDIVFLCMALNQDFNVRRLERYLSIAWDSGAKPVVVLTKSDICEDIEEKLLAVQEAAPGVKIIKTTALETTGIEEILPYLSAGTTAAFLGSSGVGKSTLVNRLLGEERLATGGIRNDDKGRHTTTHRELLFLPDGGMVIDTPGMRELGMWDAKSGIDRTFSDIEELALQCRFRDCTHGVYGLLGANGAGKTTLMRMICDVQTETQGAIMLNGKNIHDLGEQYRNILGYLPQHFGYYPNFTAYKFLMYIAAIKGLPHQKAHKRSLELLEKVGLSEQKNVKIKTFSGGMKQRLGIAQALLNNPKILILDEPTAGLDPKERVRFRNLISTLAENRIVILSTHIVSDVEYIAKEILIMKNGELLHQGSVETILQPIQSVVWECDVTRQEVDSLVKNYVVANLKHSAGAERLRIISEVAPCKTARNVEPTLEDLYLYYFAEVSDNE